MKLYLALGIAPGDVVAFVGAGGKSSTIQAVADELAEAGITFLTAPTTKMLVSEAERLGSLVTSEDAGELRTKAESAISDGASGVVVGSGLLSKNRVGGVEPATIPSLAPLADVVLIARFPDRIWRSPGPRGSRSSGLLVPFGRFRS